MDEHLRTSKGRAEMMFALGTMIRLDENSELQMIDGGMTSATVRMISGSAIIDSAHVYDPDSLIVLSNDAKIEFPEYGYYRIDAHSGQPVTLTVFEGKAVVSTLDKKKDVKKRREMTFSNDPSTWSVVKFKKKEKGDDALDQWSKIRAKTIEERATSLMASGMRSQQDKAAQQMYKMYMRTDLNRNRNSIKRPGGRMPGGGGGGGGARAGGGSGGGGGARGR